LVDCYGCDGLIVVVARYFLQIGSIALQESVTYLHAAVFFLGIAYTLKHGGHVRVDIFYRQFSPRKQLIFGWDFLFNSKCSYFLPVGIMCWLVGLFVRPLLKITACLLFIF
jgi:TRAP-type mannitol/chloroaromatic compound transport system permease small subunit